ncbi:MAG: MBL fold metallo-hydrolase [Promethearchaeota archaeon]
MKIHWVSHACFHVSSGDKHVYFDPYQLESSLPKASVIFVSHEHYDHADTKSIKSLLTDDTVVVCPKTCTGKLKKFKPVGLDPGETKEISGIKVTGFPAYTFPGKPFHPKENKWLGYIVELEGKKLYHAGDCDIMDDMKDLEKQGIDIAMLPVGDKGFTMDFNDACKAVDYIKPKIVIPMHDWDQDLEPFKKLVENDVPGTKVEILRDRDLEL